MTLTFTLLGLAILAVWVPGPRRIVLWPVLFIAAIVAGLQHQVLDVRAVMALGALCLSAYVAVRTRSEGVRTASTVAAGAIALALALHLAPGFSNPKLLDQVELRSGAAPVTQFLNFDKGSAGLLLLAAFAPRFVTLKGAGNIVLQTAAVGLATIIIVFGAGMALHFVRLDPMVPAFAASWLATNLFFTVIAEEAFFRGLLQEQLSRRLAAWSPLKWLPAAVSAVLFGLAHAGGGATYVLLTTLVGAGCAVAYALTRRIEAPVLVHFGVNAVLFLGFTTA